MKKIILALCACLLPASAALALTPASGTFGGTASGCVGSCPQVTLHVTRGDKLTAAVTNWDAGCQSAATGFLAGTGAHNAYDGNTRFTRSVRITRGSFRDVATSSGTAHYGGPGTRAKFAATLSGRFASATKASATFHIVVTLTNGGKPVDRCTDTETFRTVTRG